MKKKSKNKIGKLKIANGNLIDDMLDQDQVKKELAACLIQGDRESFVEILAVYVDSIENKKQLSEKTNLSRDTIYRVLKKKNLSVDSVFKILNAG